MFLRWQLAAHVVATIAIALGFCGDAGAVAKVGTPMRVDVDQNPSTPIYRFGLFYLIRTATGGFAVAWEEDTQTQSPNVLERVRYRIYGNTFAPVAGPKAADISGAKREPGLSRIVPLGANNAYLVYALTRDNNSPDHPTIREGFGQKIALATGAASGPRQLLNPPATGNWDSLISIPSGLPDGRAVVAWYEADRLDRTPGRFISGAGALQTPNLDFACCTGAVAQLTALHPLGTNIVGSYLRNSIFPGSNGLYGRVFKADGKPLAAAKLLLADPALSHSIKTLSNGRIAVFKYVLVSSNPNRYKLVVQLYDKTWATIGTAKTLVPDVSTTRYVDFTPTLDGGVFMLRNVQNGSVYTRSVRRLNANFATVGPDYTFASQLGEFLRVATLSATRAVVVYRNTVAGRQRMFAQILSY